jgi:hypothetical protein
MVAVTCGPVAGVAGAASTSSGQIYWANANSNTIGRANLDGTDVDQSFIKGANGPSDVLVAGEYIYWGNATGGCTEDGSCPGSIGRANLNGTDVDENFIPADTPYGLAVDGQYIYWSNTGSNTIGRANLDGTGVDQNFITGLDQPDGVVVNGSNIYWANFGTNAIGEANIDGTDVNLDFITGADLPEGMAINGSNIFWDNQGGASIAEATLAGTAVNQKFIAAPAYPTRVAVDGDNIFWTTWTSDVVPSSGSIGEANIDGTDVNNSFINIPADDTGVGVAVTTESVPVASSATVSLARARVSGDIATVNVSCQGSAGANCALRLTLSGSETGTAVVLGRGSSSLSAGQSKIVRLTLDGVGRRLLSHRHRLVAKLLASAPGQTIPTQTLLFE